MTPVFHFHFPGFIEMQDLLHGFTDPNVMDIKMGTRTFLESEVTNLTARPDLYEKVSQKNKYLLLYFSFFSFNSSRV